MTKNSMRVFKLVPALFLAAVMLPAPQPFRLQEATIEQIQAALKGKRITCRDLIGHYLQRIEAYDQAGPKLNAVQTVNKEALNDAERLDAAARSAGFVGPLHCIPVLVKDQVETRDWDVAPLRPFSQIPIAFSIPNLSTMAYLPQATADKCSCVSAPPFSTPFRRLTQRCLNTA